MAESPWRSRLRPASFRGAEFHVETGGKASGRRIVVHEYPKRDDPYSEDMGRRARRFTVHGYVIGGNASAFDSDYIQARDALIAACEQEGSATLVHPTQGTSIVVCESYTCNETRTRGNMAEFELSFAEAGVAPNSSTGTDTQGAVNSQADATGQAAATSLDANLNAAGEDQSK